MLIESRDGESSLAAQSLRELLVGRWAGPSKDVVAGESGAVKEWGEGGGGATRRGEGLTTGHRNEQARATWKGFRRCAPGRPWPGPRGRALPCTRLAWLLGRVAGAAYPPGASCLTIKSAATTRPCGTPPRATQYRPGRRRPQYTALLANNGRPAIVPFRNNSSVNNAAGI